MNEEVILSILSSSKPNNEYDIPGALDLSTIYQKVDVTILVALCLTSVDCAKGICILDRVVLQETYNEDQLYSLLETCFKVLLPTEHLLMLTMSLWVIAKAQGTRRCIDLILRSCERIETFQDVLDCLSVERYTSMLLYLLDDPHWSKNSDLEETLTEFILDNQLKYCESALSDEGITAKHLLTGKEIEMLESRLRRLQLASKIYDLPQTQGQFHSAWEIYLDWRKHWLANYLRLYSSTQLPFGECLRNMIDGWTAMSASDQPFDAHFQDKVCDLVLHYCGGDDESSSSKPSSSRILKAVEGLAEIGDQFDATKVLTHPEFLRLIQSVSDDPVELYWNCISAISHQAKIMSDLVFYRTILRRVCSNVYGDIQLISSMLKLNGASLNLGYCQDLERCFNLDIDPLCEKPATTDDEQGCVTGSVFFYSLLNQMLRTCCVLRPEIVKCGSDGALAIPNLKVGYEILKYLTQDEIEYLDKKCGERILKVLATENRQEVTMMLSFWSILRIQRFRQRKQTMIISQIIKDDVYSEIMHSRLQQETACCSSGKDVGFEERLIVENLTKVDERTFYWLNDLLQFDKERGNWAKLWMLHFYDIRSFYREISLTIAGPVNWASYGELTAKLIEIGRKKHFSVLPIQATKEFGGDEGAAEDDAREELCSSPSGGTSSKQGSSNGVLSEITDKMKRRAEYEEYEEPLTDEEQEQHQQQQQLQSEKEADTDKTTSPAPFILPTAISLGKTLWKSGQGVSKQLGERVKDIIQNNNQAISLSDLPILQREVFVDARSYDSIPSGVDVDLIKQLEEKSEKSEMNQESQQQQQQLGATTLSARAPSHIETTLGEVLNAKVVPKKGLRAKRGVKESQSRESH